MTRQTNTFSWKIGGEAGFGIMSSGEIFAKTCMRAGLRVFDYSEYPSLIRGGHNTYQVFATDEPVQAWRKSVNILVALNRETIKLHLDELSPNAAIIYDQEGYTFRGFDPSEIKRTDLRWFGLPLSSLARQHGGAIVMRNTVALGATFALLSVPLEFPLSVLKDIFGSKGPAMVDMNVHALEAGYQSIAQAEADQFPWDLEPQGQPAPQIFLTGNEAVALGAIQAGCRFYAAYPMTPASTVLSYLAAHGPKYGMLVRHAEDEIGVINETVGAAHTGVRSMCGTSGGGFALMTETVGLAGMAEVGIVVVEAQRGGPSTGLPTWTEQGDLRQVLHASQGDFLKIVLAPGDVDEAFVLTQHAFNLAEQYQTPVILLTDKYLAESHASTTPFSTVVQYNRGAVLSAQQLAKDDSYRRYATDVTNGISPRSLPGMAHGLFLANSDEHDPYGFSVESADNRIAQVHKRAKKAAAVLKEWPAPKLLGPKKADLTIVSWGSSKGPVEDARMLVERDHRLKANHLHLTMINPFPAKHVAEILGQAQTTVMVEGNHSGQLEGWITQHTAHQFDHHLRQYDGRPFAPEELALQLYDLVR